MFTSGNGKDFCSWKKKQTIFTMRAIKGVYNQSAVFQFIWIYAFFPAGVNTWIQFLDPGMTWIIFTCFVQTNTIIQFLKLYIYVNI